DVPAGETHFVDVPTSGTVLFRDNVIYAKVDVGGAVAETSETNNVYDTARGCTYRPPVGPFDPAIEWEWLTSRTMSTYTEVDTVPLVADVDGDTVPNVVFPSGASQFADGVVRALDGRTGAELWTATAANAHVWSSGNL